MRRLVLTSSTVGLIVISKTNGGYRFSQSCQLLPDFFPEGQSVIAELRVKGALPRMEALNQVTEQHGVTHLAAICAICKSQFSKILPYYGFEMDQVVSIHQLVSNAIQLDGQQARVLVVLGGRRVHQVGAVLAQYPQAGLARLQALGEFVLVRVD